MDRLCPENEEQLTWLYAGSANRRPLTMSEWCTVHQRHVASRTQTIRDQSLFSDVEVHVQGVVFRCHRYVLAQSSDFFFAQFTDGKIESSPAVKTARSVQPSRQPHRPGTPVQVQAKETLKIKDHVAPTTEHPTVIEKRDVYEHQLEILESLGTPAKTRSNRGPTSAIENPQPAQKARVRFYGTEEITAFTSNKDCVTSSLSPRIPSASVDLTEQESLKPFSTQTEPAVERLVLKLDCVSADIFRVILDAVYSGKDPVTVTNVLSVCKVATRLKFTSLKQHCEEVILDLLRRRKLDASRILQDSQMAVENSNIIEAALDALLTDFGHASSKTKWFLGLSPETLLSVLNDQRLNVRHEDEVYRALMDWYDHDPWSREGCMGKALTQIRLANLSKRTLVEEVLLHPLCSAAARGQDGKERGGSRSEHGDAGSDVKLLELVQRALAYHLLPDRRHDEMLPCAHFRPSQASERVLLVIGDDADKLYGFSFARRAWFKLAPPPRALGLGVVACTHGDDLYVSGGDKAMSKFWRYRAGSNRWKELKDLKVGRRSHCSVAVGDSIYVLGGKDDKWSVDKDTLDSVEVFDVHKKGEGWSVMTSAALPVPVRSMAAAVVEDKVYVFGGRTNGFQKTVSVIQCFDTVTQQSSIVDHLASPSCLGRPFVVNKVIYILESNGDILRFQPKNLRNIDDKNHKGELVKCSVETDNVQYQSRNEPRQTIDSSTLEQRLQDIGEKTNYSSIAEEALTKAGCVQTMNWKWSGVARNHTGTLYVVAGELHQNKPPQNATEPDLSLITDDDATFNDVRFICPEKMSLCYVSAHMCIPKAFLLEKLA